MGFTTFGNIDFRGAEGLDTIKHSGPSTIGIDSFVRSEGNIPEIFLRQAGVAESAITYARSLNNMPIKHYSCLICYSHQDQEFAEHLYTDLQQRGIRCWYAPAGMTTGQPRIRIEEATNLYDRLLLVCSKHTPREGSFAQASREILAEETKRNTLILFPIRLDNNTLEQKDMQIYNFYDIPFTIPSRYNFDFTHWKHHENYQQVLNQLVQCLQSDSTLYKSKGEADQQQEQKQKRPPRPWKSILYEAELRATLDPHLAEIEVQKFREQEGKTPEELAKLLGLPIEDVTPYEPPPPPPVVVEYDDEGFEIDAFGLEKKQEQE